MQATITSKGQVTVPKPIRDRLHLKAGDKMDFVLEADGCVRVTPVNVSVTRLKGMVPRPEVPVSLEEMDAAITREGSRKR